MLLGSFPIPTSATRSMVLLTNTSTLFQMNAQLCMGIMWRPPELVLSITNSMSFVAIDNQGFYHLQTLMERPMARNQNRINFPVEENSISIRSYKSRIHISVPNCVGNALVMWGICQSQSLLDALTDLLRRHLRTEHQRGLSRIVR